jgi:hypothetical protein
MIRGGTAGSFPDSPIQVNINLQTVSGKLEEKNEISPKT